MGGNRTGSGFVDSGKLQRIPFDERKSRSIIREASHLFLGCLPEPELARLSESMLAVDVTESHGANEQVTVFVSVGTNGDRQATHGSPTVDR